MSFKWILVSLEGEDGFVVANRRSIPNCSDLKEGDEIDFFLKRGVLRRAKVVRMSNDKTALELEMSKFKATHSQETAKTEEPDEAPRLFEDVENADFSASGSSWGPESQASSDSEAENDDQPEEMDLSIDTRRQYTTNKERKLTPALRPEPIIPNNIYRNERNQNKNRNSNFNKSFTRNDIVYVNSKEISTVKIELANLRAMLGSLKQAFGNIIRDTSSTNHLYETRTPTNSFNISNNNGVTIDANIQTGNDDENMNETPLDNVTLEPKSKEARPVQNVQSIKQLKYGMIRRNTPKVIKTTNEEAEAETGAQKCQTQVTKTYNNDKTVKSVSLSKVNDKDFNAMLAIGSGKTYVTKRIFNQIDWNSYTMATRKLLMAVFPRKVLATHSMTGKPSPAFTDKPAKSCLDQKKVNDIILTVTEKCHVKESLVRNAITIKCSDEYKMYRMQLNKLKKLKKNGPFRILNGQGLESAETNGRNTSPEELH